MKLGMARCGPRLHAGVCLQVHRMPCAPAGVQNAPVSSPQATFVSDPRRDAHAAIRGFYYQVIISVQRWLGLPADHELELECGEDIDELSATTAPASRLLEQLSHQPTLSLRSKKSLAALAHFHEHRQRNPLLSLSFRFTSTARPARELGSSFPRNLAGIDAWDLYRLSSLTASEGSAFLVALRDLVRTAPCPPNVPAGTFSAFVEWCSAASDDALTEFVRSFEWGVGDGGCAEAEEAIHRDLLLTNSQLTPETARLQADLLVVHVLRLLTSAGPKRLTRQSLTATLAQHTIPRADRDVLDAVRSLLGPIRETVEATYVVAQDTASTARRIEDALANLVATAAGPARHVAPIDVPQPDAIPPAPPLAVERPAIDDACYDPVAPTVVWLHGQSGMGKTAIAVSCSRRAPSTVWIQFEHNDSGDTQRERLTGQVLRIALGSSDPGPLLAMYQLGQIQFPELVRLACSQLPVGALLVLDDLAILPTSARFLALISGLVELLRSAPISILITSQYRPPAALSVTCVEVPPFSASETRVLLAAAGGPANILNDAFLGVVQASTRGHPTLVQALARYLRAHGWRVDDATLVEILSSAPLEDAREQAARQVRHTLTGSQRQFLYRLSLIGAAFSTALARAVAAVDPPTEDGVELLHEALGPWVTRIGPDHYEVSALLSGFGKDHLSLEVARSEHLTVARHLLAAATIDQYEAARIAAHFVAGQHWSELAVFLLSIADGMRELRVARALEFLVHLRHGTTWPSTLPAHVVSVFLATQARLLCILGLSPTEPLAQLDHVVEAASVEEVFAPLFLAGPMNQDLDVGLRAARTLAVARSYRHLPDEMRLLPWPITSLFWLGATRIRSAAEVREVLSVLERMTPDERRESLESELFLDIGTGFLDRLWLLELDKDPGERRWQTVLQILRDARRIGHLEGSGLLKTLAVRAEATALGQAGRFDEAFSTLADALGQATLAEDRLLLHYTATCLCGDREDDAGKLVAAEKALAEDPGVLPFYRELTRRLAIPAAARIGNLAATKGLLLRGVAEERASESRDRWQRELRGELVWLWWSVGQPRRAVGALAALVLPPDLLPDDAEAEDFYRKVVFSAKKLEEGLGSARLEPPAFPCGLFVTKGSLVTDAKGPCPAPAALYAVGSVAVKAELPHLACALLQRAKGALSDTGGDWGPSPLLLLLVDHLLAGIAARLGRYEEALGYAVDCISDKAVVLTRERATPVAGEPPPPSDDSPEDVERLLIAYSIAPAIVHALGEEANALAALREIDRLRARVTGLGVGSTTERAMEVLRSLRRAFSPLTTIGTLQKWVQASSPASGMRPLLALAVSLSQEVSREAAAYQAIAVVDFQSIASADDTGLLTELARFVLKYWSNRDGSVQAAGSFPGEEISLRRAAALLARCVGESGVTLSDSMRASLQSLADNP